MTKDLFEKVAKTITERGRYYGNPKENYQRTAVIWSMILKADVKPSDVLLCMVGTKLCREVTRHKLDNIVDMVGYLKLYMDMEGELCKRSTKPKKIKQTRKK